MSLNSNFILSKARHFPLKHLAFDRSKSTKLLSTYSQYQETRNKFCYRNQNYRTRLDKTGLQVRIKNWILICIIFNFLVKFNHRLYFYSFHICNRHISLCFLPVAQETLVLSNSPNIHLTSFFASCLIEYHVPIPTC